MATWCRPRTRGNRWPCWRRSSVSSSWSPHWPRSSRPGSRDVGSVPRSRSDFGRVTGTMGPSQSGGKRGRGMGADGGTSPGWHVAEPHSAGIGQRLNWLRAGVLGANDGIVSTAGLVVGVAAVTPDPGPILTAGIAGLVAGAVSMALGEYVSVSSQRDTERALLAKEKAEL